jgi:hypothetical protein
VGAAEEGEWNEPKETATKGSKLSGTSERRATTKKTEEEPRTDAIAISHARVDLEIPPPVPAAPPGMVVRMRGMKKGRRGEGDLAEKRGEAEVFVSHGSSIVLC